MTTTIVTWNVNGIRALHGKNTEGKKITDKKEESSFSAMLRQEKPNILCLQEMRCPETFRFSPLPYSYIYYSKKKGQSGTLLASDQKPLSITCGIEGIKEEEGRIMTMEFDDFFIVNSYSPNSGRHRLDYRVKIWEPALRKHIIGLEGKKEVILCGDLNCIPTDLDMSKSMKDCPGSTLEEKESFFELQVECNIIDVYRQVYPSSPGWTWHCPLAASRGGKRGCRLDYFLTTLKILSRVKSINVLEKYKGSDHFPVRLDLTSPLGDK